MARFSLVNNVIKLWFSFILRRKKVLRGATKRQGFSKCLSTHQLIHLGVGATLGTGIYVVAGQVAANIAGPAVIISFTIAAITSILSGLCYAEFGSRVPNTTGSAYTYSYVTVGEIWAFFIGWNLILEYMIGTAADAAALSGSFDYAIGFLIKRWTLENIGTFNTTFLGDYPDLLSFTFTILVTIVLAFGVQESACFTVLLNVFNISVVLFIVITGAMYINTDNWTQGGGFFPYGASGVLSGAATCFYGFVGFDIIATTGEEAKNPSKSIPIAIVVSLCIIFVCYFGVSAIITLMVPYDKLDKLSPIPDAFSKRGMPWANYIISIGAICGLSSSLLGNLFPLPRVIYAMADDGLLFKMFTHINPRTEVPVNATIYPGIITAIVALLLDLDDLVEMMSIGTLLAYTLVSLCILILRYQPDCYYNHECSLQPLIDPDNSSNTSSTNENNEAKDITLLKESLLSEQRSSIKKTYTNYDDKNINFEKTQMNDLDKQPKISHLDNDRLSSSSNNSDNDRNEPTLKTGRTVTCACLSLFLWFFGFNSTLLFAFDQLLDREPWAIFLMIFFGLLIVISCCIIYRMPQSKAKFVFMAPFVPALPIVAIYANTFLMLKLSIITWIRFAVWMIIGILIYVFYGAVHSKAGKEEMNGEH